MRQDFARRFDPTPSARFAPGLSRGLAAHRGHFRRPRGLAWSGLTEAGELADLVDEHLAWVAAQLTPSGQEPVYQLLAGVRRPDGDVVA